MEIANKQNFDDIRPLYDHEVPHAINTLLSDDYFRQAAEPLLKPISWEVFSEAMLACKSVYDFQRTVIYPFMKQLIAKTTSELNAVGFDKLKNGSSHILISNHRDIVLDAAFLNILFFDKKINTSEIAIGDNLLIYPWIIKLVRLNKSFIVKRSVSVREMLDTSKHLSEYIFDTIANRNQSVWIAQREGRAKDSDDKTQTSLLKMLTLHNSSNPVEALKPLNILPLSITYEFDPCDYLKAQEYQLKRDNPEYKKSQADDIENMRTGILGFKGRVSFKFGDPINSELSKISSDTNRAQVLELAAKAIDTEIYKNYTFFPINYIAYDLMENNNSFSDKYTDEDKAFFDNYLNEQITKINIPNKDHAFLREKLIEMYGNTVKNFVSAQEV
ncbi:MAG: 1-acyl-sn-glycerol-3-phosphate acyltransferase [Bacteroidia bacterium]|nr:1-acyl-sn-glycerol-3-phosphate acyltransferase [Bacteroidia bacterium]